MTDSLQAEEVAPRRIRVPHTYTIIFILIILAGVLTWVVPGGKYDRADLNGREVVVAGTYHAVESHPQSVGDIFKSILGGFEQASEIVGFVLIIGGVFAIINKTGAIEASIGYAVKRLKNNDLVIIPVCMLLFGLAGSVAGMSEELIPFYMIFIPLMRSLGYDTLTGISVVLIGSECGYLASTTNPFTVGISQGIAQIAPGTGIEYRFCIFVVVILAAMTFVMLHARKVKRTPSASPVYESDLLHGDSFKIDFSRIHALSFRRLLVLGIFVAGMATIVFGVLYLDWYFTDIAMIFAMMGVFGGIAGGLSEKDISESFVAGIQDVASAAFVIGFARAIVVIVQDGMIIDTLLETSAVMLSTLPKILFINLILLLEGLLTIVIPSGSGLASLTMPLFVPLSDLSGVSAQLTITAFHMGKGVVSLFTPTSGVLLTALTVGRVPYDKWFKFVLPLALIMLIIASAALAVGLFIGVK